MKLETCLNALLKADKVISDRRCRQYDTFRARILRMFEKREMRIAELEAALQKIANADDIFYDPYNGKYFRELQEIARKELSDD